MKPAFAWALKPDEFYANKELQERDPAYTKVGMTTDLLHNVVSILTSFREPLVQK